MAGLCHLRYLGQTRFREAVRVGALRGGPRLHRVDLVAERADERVPQSAGTIPPTPVSQRYLFGRRRRRGQMVRAWKRLILCGFAIYESCLVLGVARIKIGWFVCFIRVLLVKVQSEELLLDTRSRPNSCGRTSRSSPRRTTTWS